MNSLTDILFSDVNITLTILVILLITYWLITMVSGIDFDLDVDVDIDIDVDVDVDADIDIDTGIEGGNIDFHDVANAEVNKEDVVGKRRKPLRWWQILLIYFNFVGLPFMFTFTAWIFIWWMCTAVSTTITESYDNSFGFVLMLAGFFPSLFLTKIFTTPFKSFFNSLNQDGDKPVDLLGRTGIINSSLKDDELGLIEVKVDSKTFTVYAKSMKGSYINQGDKVLIIEQSSDKNYYYIQSYL